jgi:hypothetical protein
MPQGRTREDPQLLTLSPVPVHIHSLPGRIRPAGPTLQAPLTCALQGLRAPLTLWLQSWPMVQRSIPVEARDYDHIALDTRECGRDRGKAAINHQH